MRIGVPLLVVALVSATWAGEWPGFRGPGGSAVCEEKPPVRWGKGEGVRWKADLPGQGLSGPVVAATRVYVTACSGHRHSRLHVLCFDAVTGKRRWERQLAATGNTVCNPETNMAAPTPAADGSGVYALFATGDLAAFDRDGNLLWYRALARDYPDITNQVGMAASPILAGRVLLVPMENAGDSFVAGIDVKTGRNLWRVKRPRGINWVSPIVFSWAGRTAALFQTETEATAYEVTTGKLLWTYRAEGLSAIKSPASGGGLVFVAGNKLVALRPGKTGSAPQEVWSAGNLAQGYASPLYHRGSVYYLTPVALICLDAADGQERWRRRVEGPFDASPVIAGGRLYAVNNRGRTAVVELGDEPRVVARNELNDRIQATPAVAGGCLYFRSSAALYCVGPGR
jgi:outer membrane protein assembly factor BamB